MLFRSCRTSLIKIQQINLLPESVFQMWVNYEIVLAWDILDIEGAVPRFHWSCLNLHLGLLVFWITRYLLFCFALPALSLQVSNKDNCRALALSTVQRQLSALKCRIYLVLRAMGGFLMASHFIEKKLRFHQHEVWLWHFVCIIFAREPEC